MPILARPVVEAAGVEVPVMAASWAVVAVYNLAILVGTAWLVMQGWSPWWFLLALVLLASAKTKDGDDE